MFAQEGGLMVDACETIAPANLYIEGLETSFVRIEHKNTKLDNISPSKLVKGIVTTQKRVTILMSATAMVAMPILWKPILTSRKRPHKK